MNETHLDFKPQKM